MQQVGFFIFSDDESCRNFFIDDCRLDQPVLSEIDDNETADEYYVILDKPYRYYDHDDLDLYVQSESARVFSEFKENTKSIENENFMCNRSSDRVSFVQLYDNALVKVKKAVNVDKDFYVTIQVNEQKLSTTHDIWRFDRVPRVCHTSRALEHILKVVDSYSVCVGNPDKNLQDLVPVGSFLDSKVTNYTDILFLAPILHQGQYSQSGQCWPTKTTSGIAGRLMAIATMT